jgi:glycosyltransferase involved in cell wall biosynthesis
MVLTFPERLAHKAWRILAGKGLQVETTTAYSRAFKRYRTEAVLAEYGPNGVRAMEACKRMGIPLIVHFFGFDATEQSILKDHAETYPAMFAKAAAVIACSRAMQKKLISLGAHPDIVHYNLCGADCEFFHGAVPNEAAAVFLAVGRFVEKKAPQLTIKAFAKVNYENPDSRLRMVGDGPLLSECQELVKQLKIERSVTFLGIQPPSIVLKEMQAARCFVQHSVEASNGDCEGTPVGILEAGASGLPVISTYHGGIPDVVIEGETGFLVNERDVDGMAERMLHLARSPELAGELGRQARLRIKSHFSIEHSLNRLWSIIESCIPNRDRN